MSELQKLIEDYQASNDGDEQAQTIMEFEWLEDDRKWDFLFDLIACGNTSDSVKIEIYRIMEVAELASDRILEAKDVILADLQTESDEVVRQYAYMALKWHFNHFPEVIECCLQCVESEDEDINTRHNAFAVLEQVRNPTHKAEIVERVGKVSGFRKYL